MLATTSGGTPPPWPAPPRIGFARIDLASGKLAGELCEESGYAAFTLSTIPAEECDREGFGWERLLSRYTFDKDPGENL